MLTVQIVLFDGFDLLDAIAPLITVDGDHMTGISKAGVLPASKLTGKRIYEVKEHG